MKIEARDSNALIAELLAIAEDFILGERNHLRLGQSLRDMLKMAEDFCKEEMWQHAIEVCDRGREGLSRFTMDYVGASMDLSFGIGTVNYYWAIALVGDSRVEEALKTFSLSCKTFKDNANNPIAAAAAWLALAELHSFRGEYNEALWSLQFGRNLLETRPIPLALDLRNRIDEEYAQAKDHFNKQMRATAMKSRSTVGKRQPIEREHNLIVFPVFTDLAAGTALWMADSALIEDYVEIDQVRIKGKAYRVVNLRDEGTVVPIESSKLYGVARIKGNSMNKSSSKLTPGRVIEDNDYVLICASRGGRYAPRDGDITAASIADMSGQRGVVKRFRMIKGEAWLVSESTNPDEVDISLEEVRGEPFAEVIAVLKPQLEKRR